MRFRLADIGHEGIRLEEVLEQLRNDIGPIIGEIERRPR